MFTDLKKKVFLFQVVQEARNLSDEALSAIDALNEKLSVYLNDDACWGCMQYLMMLITIVLFFVTFFVIKFF